jgi:hypothetical protein
VPALQGLPGAAREVHGQVVAIDDRDVVVVLGGVRDGELGLRRRRVPGTGQESSPEQSPVAQWPLLLLPLTTLLKEHPVRPHILPLVPTGTSRVHVWPGLSCTPPPTGVAAGHIVKLKLLVIVKVAALAPAVRPRRKRRRQ